MRAILFLSFFIFFGQLSAQKDSIKNTRYLEDQIYIGLSYIILNKPTEGVQQRGFSNSINLGFIKDIPLNQQGSTAFGIGLGYGRNTYYQNVFISELNNQKVYALLDKDFSFRINKLSNHAIEIPLEIRWRNSTIDKYKFYRIYAGAKMSYVFTTNAKLKTDSSKIKVNGIDEINKFQLGLTLSVGYGTWNLNLYYGLSDIFKDAALTNDQPLNMKDFRVGLIFYVL